MKIAALLLVILYSADASGRLGGMADAMNVDGASSTSTTSWSTSSEEYYYDDVDEVYFDAKKPRPKKGKQCQCFANAKKSELYCEGSADGSGGIKKPNQCEKDPLCHWGPTEVSSCRDMVAGQGKGAKGSKAKGSKAKGSKAKGSNGKGSKGKGSKGKGSNGKGSKGSKGKGSKGYKANGDAMNVDDLVADSRMGGMTVEDDMNFAADSVDSNMDSDSNSDSGSASSDEAAPMYDSYMDSNMDSDMYDTTDDGVWRIQLTGQDLFIAALVLLNVVMITSICCMCSGKKAAAKKGPAVYGVDSNEEMEQMVV